MPPPYLIKGRFNYILTFRGCFNPPHQGHKETLCHAFFRGGEGIHLIAAIIFPLDDYSVASKYRRGNSGSRDLVLTLQERLNLINNSGLHGGWHWCHPRGEPGSEAFKDRLISEAATDGFNIRFITLIGPDHVDQEYGSPGYWGPTIVVGTGDPERTSLRMETETGLRKLTAYNDWRTETLEEIFIQQLGAGGNLTWLEQKLSMLFPRAMTNLPSDRDERLQMIKDRLRTGGVWFLGYKEEPLSSTRLRRALANSNDGEQLSKSITDVALSPWLLDRYVKSHAAAAPPQRKRPAEEDKGAEATRAEREGQQRQFKRLKQDFARNENAYKANQRRAWRGREMSDFRHWNRLEWQDRRDVYNAERAMTQDWKTLKDPIRKENILFQYLEKMLRESKKSADARAKVAAQKPGHA
ncbi:hypothetical protein J4E80_007991 [Alternaria sp. BMP 0032]|nr:hypothetical protein J4E80_007991 [Alternaria sp. BMP 0032]